MLQIAARRFPAARILIAPTRVQGEGAELEIAAALDALAGQTGIDVVLLVRGGGSLEDLRAFNSEIVARAIARSPAPVVSGVGHEVDVTIADLAADVRAPTPSAAAELALPDRATLSSWLARDFQRARRALAARLGRSRRPPRARARRAARARALRAAARPPRAARRGVARPRCAPRRPAWSAAVRGSPSSPDASNRSRRSPSSAGATQSCVASRDGAIVRAAGDVEPGDRVSLRVAEAEIEAAVAAVRALRRV